MRLMMSQGVLYSYRDEILPEPLSTSLGVLYSCGDKIQLAPRGNTLSPQKYLCSVAEIGLLEETFAKQNQSQTYVKFHQLKLHARKLLSTILY